MKECEEAREREACAEAKEAEEGQEKEKEVEEEEEEEEYEEEQMEEGSDLLQKKRDANESHYHHLPQNHQLSHDDVARMTRQELHPSQWNCGDVVVVVSTALDRQRAP